MFLVLASLMLKGVGITKRFVKGKKSQPVMLAENVTSKQSTSLLWIVTSKKIDVNRKSGSQSCSIVTGVITAPGGGSI